MNRCNAGCWTVMSKMLIILHPSIEAGDAFHCRLSKLVGREIQCLVLSPLKTLPRSNLGSNGLCKGVISKFYKWDRITSKLMFSLASVLVRVSRRHFKLNQHWKCKWKKHWLEQIEWCSHQTEGTMQSDRDVLMCCYANINNSIVLWTLC